MITSLLTLTFLQTIFQQTLRRAQHVTACTHPQAKYCIIKENVAKHKRRQSMDHIKITGAHEGCLKNISLKIPKHTLAVLQDSPVLANQHCWLMFCFRNAKGSIWKRCPFRESKTEGRTDTGHISGNFDFLRQTRTRIFAQLWERRQMFIPI